MFCQCVLFCDVPMSRECVQYSFAKCVQYCDMLMRAKLWLSVCVILCFVNVYNAVILIVCNVVVNVCNVTIVNVCNIVIIVCIIVTVVYSVCALLRFKMYNRFVNVCSVTVNTHILTVNVCDTVIIIFMQHYDCLSNCIVMC